MTLAGLYRSKNRTSNSQESFQLSNRSTVSHYVGDPSEEDPYLYSDASSLRRHRFGDEEDSMDETTSVKPGLIERVFALMSKVPLLRGLTRAENSDLYGAIPSEDNDSSTEIYRPKSFEDGDDEAHERKKRKSRSGPPRSARLIASQGAKRHRDKRASSSTDSCNGMNPQSSGTSFAASRDHTGYRSTQIISDNESEADEEVVSIDEDDAANPPDNSPFSQVRASVAATDDISASINTPRMWVLCLICAFAGSATNLFFSLRYPSVAITPVIALVVVHPLGRLWDRLLKRPDDPVETFEDGTLVARDKAQTSAIISSKWSRLRLWLAQGTWNGKEHACVYISSNVSFGFAFATDVIVEQSKFYHQDVTILYQLLLTISTQILGYSFAGLTRRYLVKPPNMIWPGTLMSTAMFTTMHSSENKPADGWSISRWKFFLVVWSGAFAWYFLPGFLVPALSYFSIITWFAPNNVVIANLVNYFPVCPADRS